MKRFKNSTGFSIGALYNVVLISDNTHTQKQVSLQIVKAMHCSIKHAWEIMLGADKTGDAVVLCGPLERCEHVSVILSKIKLQTRIEPV